jgi:hypothetical protein
MMLKLTGTQAAEYVLDGYIEMTKKGHFTWAFFSSLPIGLNDFCFISYPKSMTLAQLHLLTPPCREPNRMRHKTDYINFFFANQVDLKSAMNIGIESLEIRPIK